jgi:hypothetical protein
MISARLNLGRRVAAGADWGLAPGVGADQHDHHRSFSENPHMDDDGVLAEQRAYYQARTAEYDEWWQRRGRFYRGPESAEEWDREVAQVAAARYRWREG